MKILLRATLLCASCWSIPHFAHAQSTAKLDGQSPGKTPFIEFLSLSFHSAGQLASYQFTVAPKPGSVTRPILATYSPAYMIAHHYWDGTSAHLHVPVFGLYSGANNTITWRLTFSDGSSVQNQDAITTAAYSDSCNVLNAGQTIVMRRKKTSDISFDYMMLKKFCDTTNPTIMDTDGEIRWIGVGKADAISSIFYNNEFYVSGGKTGVFTQNFDGTATKLADYASYGVVNTNHHNYDPGRDGIIMDVNTTTDSEAVDMEIDAAGNVLHTWDFGQILSKAMIAGGDDPSGFVYPPPADWFHNNASTYNPADNTLVASSRENFVIAVDYDTQQIKWILGDSKKHWHQYKSLRAFELKLGPNTVPPIGQHAVSFNHNGDLLLYDDGFQSTFQVPPGPSRKYSAPRAYHIDTTAMTATETYKYPQDRRIYTQVCGSVYEDAPNNLLIDYATEDNRTMLELVGLNDKNKKVYDYLYPEIDNCGTSWNTAIIHLENLNFQ